jgi:AcrR family transcriptional regulator
MSKSEETRRKISEIALASFRERGYEQTTIRLIAAEAGISVGNAYYYFPTKNHLVQELYLQVQSTHLEAAEAGMANSTDLATRLEAAMLAGIDAISSYHDSAPGFLAAAIAPTSAVSPFGPDAAGPRELSRQVFREVVDGATTVVPADLRRQLPEILWLAYMGLALFWVYDNSPGQKRTRRLASRATKLFGTLLPLTRLPFLRGPVNEALDIVAEARA